MFLKCIKVGSLETNCYLLGDGATGQGALVDPGGSLPLLWGEIEASGLKFTKILLTHGHFDHTGAAGELAARLGAEIFLHRADTALLGRDRIFPALGPVTPYGEGDAVAVGGLTLSVLHTPGHTPGSVCLGCEDVLFTGDTLFAGNCGRVDLLGGSEEAMAASLKRLGELEGDHRVLPGHGAETTLARERQSNPYLREAVGT